MQDNYLTMLDYEQVLKSVESNLKKMRGGTNVRGSMGGGAHIVDEETKDDPRL